MSSLNQKVLIVGPAWVGDMVMAQTLFILLKQQQPTLQIDVLAPDWSRPLLERMPEVHQAISMPLGHGQFNLAERYRIGKSLRQAGYDKAFLLTNSWKSALVPFFARIPLRTGWRGEMRWGLLNDVRYLDKTQLPLMIQRFITLGLPKSADLPRELPRPYLKVNKENIDAALQRLHLPYGKRPILALCPGAEYGPAKRWPAAYFAEVAQNYLAKGWQVWIFGSAKDQVFAQTIQQATNEQCQDLTGRTSLAEAVDLLSLANVVVSNDSGLMHIAAALQRPLVVIYGSSDPRFTPPLTDTVIILNLNLTCSPCFQRNCPLGHMKCLNDLQPQQAVEAIENLSTKRL